MNRCVSIRMANNPKKLPGEQRVYRCRNEASRAVRVHQENEHLRVGTGWYEVELCDNCFYASDSTAIVEGKWRWLHQ